MAGNNPIAAPPHKALQTKLDGLQAQIQELRKRQRAIICQVVRSSGFSVASGSETTITWSAALADDDHLWNGSQLVKVPWTGWWLVGASGYWPAAAGGRRFLRVWKNNTTTTNNIVWAQEQTSSSSITPSQVGVYPVKLTSGDQLLATAFQDSGSAQLFGDSLVASTVPWPASMVCAWLGG